MKGNKPVIKGLVMITQIGISMIVPIFLGVFIGYRLDCLFGTGFLFFVFLLFGILAAFRNIYKLTKPFYAEALKREEKEQAYWESLKKERLLKQQTREEPDAGAYAAPQSGAAARRGRMQSGGERERQTQGNTLPKDRRETAEEAFAAWRRERERSHDREEGGGGHGEA